ncbi:MAG: MFS transporter [Methanomicrobium sp.]|nr:MFS transporter [Methanomicrobium sp.]
MQIHLTEKNYFRIALPLFSACIVLPMFSESMLVAALPAIEHEFNTSGIIGAWILPVVLLVGAALCPFFGTLGDSYGRKKILAICLFIYSIGVIAAGFSFDIWSLLFFRSLQGMGIAAIPIAFAMISEQFPPKKVPVGIGVLAASYGVGTMTGILCGSYIINYWGWRWTYFTLIPVVIIHLFLILFVLKNAHETDNFGTVSNSSENDSVVKSKGISERKADYKGAFLLLLAMFFFLLTITEGFESGWFVPEVFIHALLTVIFTAAFISAEKKALVPAIDLSLVKRPVVIIISAVAFLVNCMTFLYIQALPFIIQSPSGLFLEERFVGLIMIPGSVADMIASPLSSFWIREKGFLAPVIFGSLCMALTPAIFFLFPLTIISLSAGWIFFSIGMAVVSTAYLLKIIKVVPPNRTAGATGLLHSSINIGGMTGPVFAGVIIASSASRFLIAGEYWTFPSSEAFTFIFATGGVMSAVILILAVKSTRIPE